MKKLIALILTLSMLLSMVVVSAATVSEAERQEILNAKQNSFVSLAPNANVDVYASIATIADYGRFNKSITGSTDDNFAKTTYNGKEVFDVLPDKTYAGEVITGTEDFYSKGFYTKALIESKKKLPSYTMLADDLLEEDGTRVTGYRYDVSSSDSPKKIYDEAMTRTAVTRKVASTHVVERFVEDGKNYAVIENFGIKHKIGPIDGSAYSPNSVYLSSSNPTIAVGTKGEKLSLLVGTNNFTSKNFDEKVSAVGAKPKAALNKVTVTYADGTKATKYFLMANSVNYNDYKKPDAELSIVYAPKKDNWTAADLYGESRVTAKLLNNENSAEHGIADVAALTSEDFTFKNPDILMTDSAKLASWINSRQDACDGNYGQRVTMVNIPLENKEVMAFTPNKFYNYISENIPTAIPVGTSTSEVRQAFIPVTVKGANPDYDYFAWVGAITDNNVLLGATITQPSLKTKIDALNEVLKSLDSETLTPTQITYYRAQIEALKATSEYILDKDFDTTALDEAEKGDEPEVEEPEEPESENAKKAVYAPVEMGLLSDYFATKAERRNQTEWINSSSYLAYLGYKSSNSDRLPMDRTDLNSGGVISIDAAATSLSGIAELKNDRYVLTIDGVPYTMGKTQEGVMDGNAFAPGETVKNIENNLALANVDEKYTLELKSDGTYYTIVSGKYPVATPTSKINVVTTSMENQSKSASYCLYTVDAKVYLDNGETVDYTLLTGEGVKTNTISPADAILFVPKASASTYNSYSAINGAIGGAVKTLADMPNVKLTDIKLPSAPEAKGPKVDKGKLVGLDGNTNLATRQFYYQNVILPEAYQILDVDRSYVTYAYANSFEITAPEGTKITAVEFIHDSGGSYSKDEDGYANTVGAYIKTAGATNSEVLVPATVEGLEDYDVYVRTKRNCHHCAVIGMTAESTVGEMKKILDNLMEKAKTVEDIDEVEKMKVFVDEKNLLSSDLSESAKAKYDAFAKSVDVKVDVASTVTDKVTVDLTVTNHTKLAGKKFTVVVAFYDVKGKLLKTVPKSFTTTTERDITETVNIDSIPANTVNTQVYVIRDFLSLISLIN